MWLVCCGIFAPPPIALAALCVYMDWLQSISFFWMNGTERRHESLNCWMLVMLLPFVTKTKSHFWPSPATGDGPSFPLLWPFHRNSLWLQKLYRFLLKSSIHHALEPSYYLQLCALWPPYAYNKQLCRNVVWPRAPLAWYLPSKVVHFCSHSLNRKLFYSLPKHLNL